MIVVWDAEGATAAAIDHLAIDLGKVVGEKDLALCAAAIRRAAAVRCPCTREELIDAVVGGFSRLSNVSLSNRELVAAAFEALLLSGDLLRSVPPGEEGRPLVHLAPPSFVRRWNGSASLIGGLPDVGLPLPAELKPRLRSRGGFRQLPAGGEVSVIDELIAAGFSEFPMDAWLQAPTHLTPSQLLGRLNRDLDDVGPAGAVDEVLVLDSSRSPRFYKGRWTEPGRRSGRFIAQTPGRWGGRRWLYVELDAGEVRKLVTLPRVDNRFRGADEAWWIQAAIDHLNGTPQSYVRTRTDAGIQVISFFSPLPMWAERRMYPVAGRVAVSRGALIAFVLDREQGDEEIKFLIDRLWVVEAPADVEA